MHRTLLTSTLRASSMDGRRAATFSPSFSPSEDSSSESETLTTLTFFLCCSIFS